MARTNTAKTTTGNDVGGGGGDERERGDRCPNPIYRGHQSEHLAEGREGDALISLSSPKMGRKIYKTQRAFATAPKG